MLVEVKVPEMGESITEGTLTQWYKHDGDFVEMQEALYELETDKITVDVPSEYEGSLHIKVEGGSRVRIGQVVATIDTELAPRAPEDEDRGVSFYPLPAGLTQPRERVVKIADERRLSPGVRRIVEEFGLDPKEIHGTGRGGRITKEDAMEHLKRKPSGETVPDSGPVRKEEGQSAASDFKQAKGPAPAPWPETGTKKFQAGQEPAERQTRTRMSSLRQRIAERLVMAQQTAAILTTFNEADMSSVLAWRERHKEIFKEKYGVSLGFMSFFVKAAVDALKAIPAINAQIQGDEIVQNHYYDIGVAIGTDRGLVVPVIREADRLSFGEIEKAIADLSRRVREKTITLGDLTGGVFTISNGGVYGSLMSTPILNPPQSGILGMHAVKKRPVVVEDQIVIRPMMYLALSYDHRLVDGQEAVTFLKRIVQCIENPERMLLEV